MSVAFKKLTIEKKYKYRLAQSLELSYPFSVSISVIDAKVLNQA
ncbi:hypothetical protein [Bacteroidetes bacterium endosymbiont of Geopemphigus sp.]|nr:hypothetical protein [Bacteroidetes bacterium endosymbiont of Geopemphigus sp.]